jgi:hypothetical protein
MDVSEVTGRHKAELLSASHPGAFVSIELAHSSRSYGFFGRGAFGAALEYAEKVRSQFLSLRQR